MGFVINIIVRMMKISVNGNDIRGQEVSVIDTWKVAFVYQRAKTFPDGINWWFNQLKSSPLNHIHWVYDPITAVYEHLDTESPLDMQGVVGGVCKCN